MRSLSPQLPDLFAPGACPACRGRLAPAECTWRPVRPHFRCAECRGVYSMDANFELTPCETPAAHVMPVPTRDLEAEARELRERYFPRRPGEPLNPRARIPALWPFRERFAE